MAPILPDGNGLVKLDPVSRYEGSMVCATQRH